MTGQDQEWKAWLDTNLQRGCDTGGLYRILRENGFDTGSIRQMMGEAFPDGIEAATDTSIDYAALAQIVETHGKSEGWQRFDTPLLQLYSIDNFLTPEECERVITLTEAKLRPSSVTHSNGDNAFRTSMTCDLRNQDDPIVAYLDEKISWTLGVRLPYSEAIQAQHYSVGQEFKAHHDYFAPNMDIYKEFTGQMGQRTWTFAVYLNDVSEGGGTYFPYIGHTFYPKQGQAVIWNNLHPDGTPNRHTLHHGMPVEKGKKVIITKWFREKGYGDMFYPEEETLS